MGNCGNSHYEFILCIVQVMWNVKEEIQMSFGTVGVGGGLGFGAGIAIVVVVILLLIAMGIVF